MKGYKVEYQVGKVSLNTSNLLVQDIDDMETLEFWEKRLKRMGQHFAVVYREVEGRVLYSIFTNARKKGSIFK